MNAFGRNQNLIIHSLVLSTIVFKGAGYDIILFVSDQSFPVIEPVNDLIETGVFFIS